MEKFMYAVAFSALASSVLVHCATARTVHVVGDNLGWVVPQNNPSAYTTWASGKTFMVGDVLVFNFQTGEHDVQKVQKTSFDACNTENSVGDMIPTGPANVTLDSAGEHYYICTIGKHCQAGQKLAISVSGAPGANPPASEPSGSTTRPGASPESSSIAAFSSVIVTFLSIAMSLFV